MKIVKIIATASETIWLEAISQGGERKEISLTDTMALEIEFIFLE